jgi:hypothetical protein
VDDLSLRVVGSALLAAVGVALDCRQEDEGDSDLLALLDSATDALAEGARELRRNPRRPAGARSSRRQRDAAS